MKNHAREIRFKPENATLKLVCHWNLQRLKLKLSL